MMVTLSHALRTKPTPPALLALVAWVLYRDGKIILEQALANADSANNLRLKIKLAGLRVDEEPKDVEAPQAHKSKPEPLQAAGAFRLRKG